MEIKSDLICLIADQALKEQLVLTSREISDKIETMTGEEVTKYKVSQTLERYDRQFVNVYMQCRKRWVSVDTYTKLHHEELTGALDSFFEANKRGSLEDICDFSAELECVLDEDILAVRLKYDKKYRCAYWKIDEQLTKMWYVKEDKGMNEEQIASAAKEFLKSYVSDDAFSRTIVRYIDQEYGVKLNSWNLSKILRAREDEFVARKYGSALRWGLANKPENE
jgi:hypothetical protein